jgi:N-acyl homoserine lactone hydrolase
MNIRRVYMGSISGPLGPATPFNGYLIDHPRGLTLVDTGFGTTLALYGDQNVEDPDAAAGYLAYEGGRLPWLRRTTVDALADHGIEPGDVKYIINTHLGDHSGDNHYFPHATFIAQKPEAEWSRRTQPHGPQSITEWDFPGAKLELLDGEDVEVLPGLTCLFTPGHTPGHQSVLYENADRKVMFCGDALYTVDIWDDPDAIKPGHAAFGMQVQMGGAEGLELWQTSAAKLIALEPDEVHFAHDTKYKHRGHRH